MVELSAGHPEWSAVWESHPTAPEAPAVIQAARAGDLAAHGQPATLA